MAPSCTAPADVCLRRWTAADLPALYALLADRAVNTFLPWFPAQSMADAEAFYAQRLAGAPYAFAIFLRPDDRPIGYIKTDTGDAHDVGYALAQAYWGRGIASAAGRQLLDLLRCDGVPYVTATHDRRNPRSGGVMRRMGMTYRYSYTEQWQPKNIPVTFRMYQCNLDGQTDRVYRGYQERYAHFVEPESAFRQKTQEEYR